MRERLGQGEGGCPGYEATYATPADEKCSTECCSVPHTSEAFPRCFEAAEAKDHYEPSAYDSEDDPGGECEGRTQMRPLEPQYDGSCLHAHQQECEDVEGEDD